MYCQFLIFTTAGFFSSISATVNLHLGKIHDTMTHDTMTHISHDTILSGSKLKN